MQRAELNASSKDGGDLPVVYVIIANHNYGTWILDALNSVVAQDYPKIGISLCDDFSTDDSVDRVLRHLEGKRLVMENEEKKIYEGFYVGVHTIFTCLKNNQLQASARNHALGVCANLATLFQILDADDELGRTKISKFVAKFQEDPETIGCVYGDYTTYRPESGLKIREFKEPYDFNRLRQECIVHSGGMVSKHALQTVGAYVVDESPCEDYSLWLRIAKRFIIVHIPEDLTLVRIHNANCTYSVPTQRWQESYRKVMERYVLK